MKPITNPQTVECPTLSPERQLLWDAANKIEELGLSCNGAVDHMGRVCTVHAINLAGDFSDLCQKVVDEFEASLNLPKTTKMLRPLGIWSDSSDQATVVAALRSAALSDAKE